MKGRSSADIVVARGPKPVSPMSHLPGVKLFANDLIDDMHKAFEAVCGRLRLPPRTDKATEMVAAKIVELAKAGQRGDDLAADALRSFEGFEPEDRAGRHPSAPKQ
jgi:hypothetical protein